MANPKLCSIPDCGKRHKGHGYCDAHLHRWTKHGDPMGGQTPKGELHRFLIEEVLPHRSVECLIWPYGTGSGYGQMKYEGRMQLVHRVVCELTCGRAPDDRNDAAHTCGNSRCVNPTHIRWANRPENMADRVGHGTANRGKRNGKTKLTEAAVREIISLRGALSLSQLAHRFGVSKSTVGSIFERRSWAWLSEETAKPTKPGTP